MFAHDTMEIGNTGNSPINAMFIELAQIDDALCDPSVDMENDDYEAAMETHWVLRERICATPARSPSELRAKALALQIEAERDEEFTNHGPGSARELAKSLVVDLLTINGA